MGNRYLHCLAFCAFFGMNLAAQSVSPANQQTLTTGMMGMTTNQTVQLNVLNLSPLPIATANASAGLTSSISTTCSVQMEFYDSQNKQFAHSISIPLAPQTATSLSQGWSMAMTGAALIGRREVRGVVVSTSTSSTSTCNLKVTMEVVDSTGSIVAMTSDVSPVPAAGN